MLYKENGEWKLCEKKITYIENGEEFEKFIGSEGEEWWNNYKSMWGINIISIEEVKYTQEQLDRLNEIKDVPEGFSDICSNYVLNGTFPEGIKHPLRDLQLSKEVSRLNDENYTLMVALAEAYEELQTLKGELNNGGDLCKIN